MFENPFKIPRGTLGSQQLLDTASSFASMLTAPVIAEFGEFGLASATPANPGDKIARFQTDRAQQNAGKSVGAASTAETKASIKRLVQARRTTAQIGENILEDSGDAGLLEAWRSACRVEKQKSKPDDVQPPPPPRRNLNTRRKGYRAEKFQYNSRRTCIMRKFFRIIISRTASLEIKGV